MNPKMTQEEVNEIVRKYHTAVGVVGAEALFGNPVENAEKARLKKEKKEKQQELDAIPFPSYWETASQEQVLATLAATAIFVISLLLLLTTSS